MPVLATIYEVTFRKGRAARRMRAAVAAAGGGGPGVGTGTGGGGATTTAPGSSSRRATPTPEVGGWVRLWNGLSMESAYTWTKLTCG